MRGLADEMWEKMRPVIRLTFSLPPAGLRRNHEVNRFTRNALKDDYSAVMYAESTLGANAAWDGSQRQTGALAVGVVWRQCGYGDVDNCLSALKVCFDSMACAPATKAGAKRFYLGVFESDAQIKRICVERERAMTRAEECVIFTLSPITPIEQREGA